MRTLNKRREESLLFGDDNRLLKALGAPKQARIYTAGGEPFGGKKALQPLIAEFPNIVTKYTLAREGELLPFINKSSAMAAIDYIVSLSSDVFVPSHGGNMGRAMQVICLELLCAFPSMLLFDIAFVSAPGASCLCRA